ncbi:MAG: hypothetical protein M3362_22055 [Acidobacteriota bacterium]|nr:hypothetical protein [Acidobacteriota bacterium]
MSSPFLKAFALLIGLTLLGSLCGQQMAEPEIHLIPAGYMGNVYIFHNVPDGEPLKHEGRARVYEIPKDGILRSQSPENPGWGMPQYFYVTPDGKREKITGYWPTSIHDTPESRADKTVGIFFPRTGSLSVFQLSKDAGPMVPEYNCDIRYEQYYVGTKLYLLTNTDLEKDLHAYVKGHPICK